jgi:hypothetical protein
MHILLYIAAALASGQGLIGTETQVSGPAWKMQWDTDGSCHFQQPSISPRRKFMSLTIEKSQFLSDDQVYLYFHNDDWRSLVRGAYLS